MQVYLVQWECTYCGSRNSFRRGHNEEDGWPNKFELTCANQECAQEQDVPFRKCSVALVQEETA